jgi:hypothetical protein
VRFSPILLLNARLIRIFRVIVLTQSVAKCAQTDARDTRVFNDKKDILKRDGSQRPRAPCAATANAMTTDRALAVGRS